jgi:hypothetical protein
MGRVGIGGGVVDDAGWFLMATKDHSKVAATGVALRRAYA